MSYLNQRKQNFLHHSLHFMYPYVMNRWKYHQLANASYYNVQNSNKSYLSLIAYHQIILEYLIIMHQIIHSFETDTSWLLDLLRLLVLLKQLIYRNDYLTFYNNIDQKGNPGDMYASIKIQKEVLFLLTWLFILFAQKIQDYTPVWIIYIKIHGKFMYNTSNS